MKKLLLFALLFVLGQASAQNMAPTILNFTLSDASQVLTITYDLEDIENDDCMIRLLVSDDAGRNFKVSTVGATGDLNMVTPGVNKKIIWDYTQTVTQSGDFVIKLVADDLQSIDIQTIVDGVDSNRLYEDLSLIEGIRHRTSGVEHLAEVRTMITDRLASYEFALETQTFDFNGYTGENYVATIPGTTSDTIYVLCAHYDSVKEGPGADDNGSGVAGLLEAARVLAPYNFQKTIKLIAFDLEEAGLKGSVDFVANKIEEDEIAGVLDFEMIGYATEEPNTQQFPTGFNILFPAAYAQVEADDFRGNFIANIGKVDQDDWGLSFAQAAETYVPDLKVVSFDAPANWQTITPDLGRSDHAPFWVTGRPAVMISGTANFRNPNYHTAFDTLGVLNFTFMANVVKASVATLAEVGEVQHSDWKTKEIHLVSNIQEASIFNITFYPNPVKEELFIDSAKPIAWAKVFDEAGHLVLFTPRPDGRLDVSRLAHGTYSIILDVDGGLARGWFVR